MSLPLQVILLILGCALPARVAELRVIGGSGRYLGTYDAYRDRGRVYLDAKQAGAIYGGQVYWYPVTGRVQMSLRGRQLQLLVDSPQARLESRMVRLPGPVLARGSGVWVPLEFFLSAEFSEFAGMDSQFDAKEGLLSVERRGTPAAKEPAAPVPAAPRRRRIVVDAGHGGRDSGAIGRRGAREKDYNLLAARELAALLKEEGAFEVTLTRDDDSFLALDERSGKANALESDLFISLHCNASASPSEHGFEIYFLSEKATDPESQRVADAENAVLALEGKSVAEGEAALLLQAMAKIEFINDASELAGLMARRIARRVDLADRGVKQAAFYVLRGTEAPAVLVEMGFLTNSKDEARLGSRRYRRRLIEGVRDGILEFTARRGWR